MSIKNLIIIFISFINLSYAQSNKRKILDANQVSALFNSNGILFQNQAALVAGYEIPKGTGLNEAQFPVGYTKQLIYPFKINPFEAKIADNKESKR